MAGPEPVSRRHATLAIGIGALATGIAAGAPALAGAINSGEEREMDAGLERQLRIMLDKTAIAESFLRYTRGIDRLDVELIKSAFHPDAIDNHSRTVRGSSDRMLQWWLPQQGDREATQHFTTNQTIDLDGDVAHVETYFFVLIKLKNKQTASFSGGRYADRFEKRGGDWRIALRVVLSEWRVEADASAMANMQNALGLERRDRTDPTYARPLRDPPAELPRPR